MYSSIFAALNAQVAKLVDALCSGRSVRKDVLVRIQFWALKWTNRDLSWFVHFYFGYDSRPARISDQVENLGIGDQVENLGRGINFKHII